MHHRVRLLFLIIPCHGRNPLPPPSALRRNCRLRTTSCFSLCSRSSIRDVTFLHKAAAVLEFATRKSKHSYQVRLLLVQMYRLLCQSSLSPACYLFDAVTDISRVFFSHSIIDTATPSLAVQQFHAMNVKQVNILPRLACRLQPPLKRGEGSTTQEIRK